MDHKTIPVKEFRERGYLQELNRRFLHPLGLALEVIVEDDGSERLGGIWDYRDDPEGMVYGPGMIDVEKAERIAEEAGSKTLARINLLGSIFQKE